ncbi:MAG: ABC transporter permease subunit [Hyphomicrobiaceae bacterium]
MISSIWIIAGREMRDGFRNRRVVASTLLLAALALTLSLIGSAPVGEVGASRFSVAVVSLSSLTTFLVPLIALVIAHDAIAGEFDRGTMLLLLSYPVRRWQIIAGKFLGHVGILTIAIFIGYGLAALAMGLTSAGHDHAAIIAYVCLLGTSVMLAAAFLAMGYCVSVFAQSPRTAAGMAIGIWLFFVILYDVGLLGILVIDNGRFVTLRLFNMLRLANPADAYRMLNLSGLPDIGRLSGMTGIARDVTLGPAVLASALLAWICLPLLFASVAFSRRQV